MSVSRAAAHSMAAQQETGEGTSPYSIRCRVAFPTLRPPRFGCSRGPAPWTKRGKRTTAVPCSGGRHPDGGDCGVEHRPNQTRPVAATCGGSGAPCGGNIARIRLAWSWPTCGRSGALSGRNIALFDPVPSCVSHPSTTAPRLISGTGAVDEAWKTHDRLCFVRGGRSGPADEHRPFHSSPDSSANSTDTVVMYSSRAYGAGGSRR